jgi:hypothetical protein
MYTNVYRKPLFIIAKTKKYCKCSGTSRWINALWYISDEILFENKKGMNSVTHYTKKFQSKKTNSIMFFLPPCNVTTM